MNTAIIAAGGSGQRVGGGTPKQFLEIDGKPIIIMSLEAFEKHCGIDEIIVVCMPEYADLIRRWAAEFGISKLRTVAPAGATRRESVMNGLKAARGDLVLIHDAARPLVTQRIISDNISAAERNGAAVTALPVADTIFRSADGLAVDGVLKRSELYRAQTPQSFRLQIITSAHESAGADDDVTDDCRLALSAGHRVVTVRGDERNFKITTPADLERLRTLLRRH